MWLVNVSSVKASPQPSPKATRTRGPKEGAIQDLLSCATLNVPLKLRLIRSVLKGKRVGIFKLTFASCKALCKASVHPTSGGGAVLGKAWRWRHPSSMGYLLLFCLLVEPSGSPIPQGASVGAGGRALGVRWGGDSSMGQQRPTASLLQKQLLVCSDAAEGVLAVL